MALDAESGRVIGFPNERVNAWGIARFVDGKWVRQTFADESGAHVRDWPLEELSLEEVRARWGAGEFRVMWFVHDPANEDASKHFRALGHGKPFRLEEEPPTRVQARAAAAAPGASLFGPEFERAMALVQMGDERASRQLTATMTMAAALAGRSNGLDATTLSMILENQSRATAEAVRQALTPVTEQLSALRRELDEDEEEDDEPVSAIGEVARAAAPALLKKGKIGQALMAYAVEHPETILEIVKASPQLLEGLSKIVSGAQASPPAAPAPRPRAALRSVPDLPASAAAVTAPTSPDPAPAEVPAS